MSNDNYSRPFPGVVRIEPAAACNLACSHCPTGTINMSRGIMRPETFEKVIEAVRANKDHIRVVVLYHGGEPLLNKRFPEMVKEIRAVGIPYIKSVSNGMLLEDDAIEAIVNSGLAAIEFSLDGESPAVNNFIRRNSDYDTVIKNIKRFIEYKRSINAEKPHIYIATAQFLLPEMHRRKDQKPEVPSYLINEFATDYAGEIAGFKPEFTMRWPHMEVFDDIYDVYFDPYDDELRNECDHVDNTITIRWNGDIVACCFDLTTQNLMGNICTEDLAEIWNGERYRDLRRSIDKREFISICDNCNTVKPNIYLTLKPEVRETLITQ